MSSLPDLLFSADALDAALDIHREKAAEFIRRIDPDRILSTPVEDLVDEVLEEFLVDPIELQVDRRSSPGVKDAPVTVEGYGRMIEVPGPRVELHVPFDGDAELFKLRPNPYTMNPPRVEVRPGVLVAAYEGRAPLDHAAARATLERQVSDVQECVGRQRNAIDPFNAELPHLARQAIESRRQKVLDDRQLEEFLDVPLQQRADAATFIAAGPKRRRPKQSAPETSSPFTPDPALSDETFGDIVEAIRSITEYMERVPQTASDMKEESLRDLILIGLNNQFGTATAESFNGNGKTDIYLPVDGSPGSVFIAECKIWKGAAGIGKAVDQILGYLTWRDTKAALIVFQRTGSPDDVRAKIVAAIQAHGSYKRDRGDEGTVFTLASPADRIREIHVALILVPLLG
ncbi:MAG: hypothetical protein ACR2MB_17130 [Acidimicrobiales bacterium]